MTFKKMAAIALSAALVLPAAVNALPIETFSSLTANAAETTKSGTCGENATWTLDDEGTLTISGTGKMGGLNIRENSENVEKVKRVVIEKGITSILGFFNFANLESVTIPDSVTSIGVDSFSGCTSLKSITIPDSVTSIENMAFEGCASLESITLPDSVTSIGDRVFEGCTSLESITIPNSVTSIGLSAFKGTPWFKAKQEENPLIIFNNILYDVYACPENVVIPDSVTIIGNYSFSRCQNLKSVTIPASVTRIGTLAFDYCTNLESITIPDSVTSFGGLPFRSTPWLTAMQKENPLVIVNHILVDGTACSGNVVIPDSVTTINADAFYCCSSLESIIIPDSVTNIRSVAFEQCTSLESITIPKSVTSIGEMAFFDCEALKSITILNPECEIDDRPETISNLYNPSYEGVIKGYKGSTAEAYAEKYNRTFVALDDEPSKITPGDANGDGDLTVADAVAILQFIGNRDKYPLDETGKANADVDGEAGITGMDALTIQKVDAGLIDKADLPLKK